MNYPKYLSILDLKVFLLLNSRFKENLIDQYHSNYGKEYRRIRINALL